ncbi:hypothetical protein TNCV_2655041 [Trichonephila clavipes]|nr:hypothetical protein TNCV_2655041 [Trichonephila clavipes]
MGANGEPASALESQKPFRTATDHAHRHSKETILHPAHVFAFCLQSGPSKPWSSSMSFLDESIRNVGECDSRKPFSPLPQAATPFVSGLRRNQMVPEQNSPHYMWKPKGLLYPKDISKASLILCRCV